METLITMYKWRPGFGHPAIKADTAGQVLEEIKQQSGGGLTAQVVVDSARPLDHPLHSAFEWDDTAAAEEYRKVQARHLIRSLVIEIAESPGSSVRAFVVVQEATKDHWTYVAVHDAMSNPELRRQVLHRAIAELTAFQNKHRDLQELSGVFKAIDSLLVSGLA